MLVACSILFNVARCSRSTNFGPHPDSEPPKNLVSETASEILSVTLDQMKDYFLVRSWRNRHSCYIKYWQFKQIASYAILIQMPFSCVQ